MNHDLFQHVYLHFKILLLPDLYLRVAYPKSYLHFVHTVGLKTGLYCKKYINIKTKRPLFVCFESQNFKLFFPFFFLVHIFEISEIKNKASNMRYLFRELFVGMTHYRQQSVKVWTYVIKIIFRQKGLRDRVNSRERLHTSFCCVLRVRFDINTEPTPKYQTTANL